MTKPVKNITAASHSRIEWHSAFYSAVQLDFYHYDFEYYFEYMLNAKPLLVYVLIINHQASETPLNRSNSDIISFFKKYNVFEYKSPKSSLNLNNFFKAIGYACILISEDIHFHKIDSSDITISFIRHSYPRELIKELNNHGFSVNFFRNGILHVTGSVPFAIQILVTKLMDEENMAWCQMLCRNLTLSQYSKLINKINRFSDEADPKIIQLIDNVMTVINQANPDIFNRKEGQAMELDYRKLFYPVFDKIIPEIQEESVRRGRLLGIDEGINEGKLRSGISTFFKCKDRGMSDEDAKELSGLTDEQIAMALMSETDSKEPS